MSLKNKLRSRIARLLLGKKAQSTRRTLAEHRRKLGGKPHVVSVFLELDDPYSYLLSCYMPEFEAAYDVQLHYLLAEADDDEAFRPRADLYAANAERDCARLAAELGVPFLDRGKTPPVEYRRGLIEALAVDSERPDFGAELLSVLAIYWRGDSESAARRVAGIALEGRGEALLRDNRERLRELGHYNCATLNYAGEWYAGLDRLHYLAARLEDLGARRPGATTARLASIQQLARIGLPVSKPGAAKALPPVELFFSFRSPYSYLAMQPCFDLCDAFGLRLILRPLLPMAMRGMQVPRQKLAYIGIDTQREADRLGVDFGKFADPLGAGVERCMAVFYYAQGEKREREFVRHAAKAIWARGIDVASDAGMRKVTARCGLFWPDVVAAMQRDDWQQAAEENRESMMASGCWGVPTLRLGDYIVWGQDRIWLLARHIEELCDTGEGIMV